MQIVNGFFDSRPKSAMQIAFAPAFPLMFPHNQIAVCSKTPMFARTS